MTDSTFRDLGDGRVVHEGGNHLKIDAIWAFISVDDDGNEGLCAAPLPGSNMTMPLIAADERMLTKLIPIAEMLARNTSMTIKLIRLGTREEIRVIAPGH
jgi:hypothetical protein